MPLFRYFTPERGLQALKNLELVVVPPKYLNDPFEFSPIIKCENRAGFARRRLEEITTSPDFFEENRSHFPAGLTFEQFRAALRQPNSEHFRELERGVSEVDQRTQAEAPDIMSRSFGVICFSAEVLNPVMWAHYASSQSGLVIEFDENHLLFSGRSFVKVEYSAEPFIFDASDRQRKDDVDLFAKRKSPKWSYEEESRLLIELSHLPAPRHTADGQRYFLPIDSQIITSVTLGLRASDQVRSEVIQSLRTSNLEHVNLFQISRNIDLDGLERMPASRA
jgi:DUF2971 family protein